MSRCPSKRPRCPDNFRAVYEPFRVCGIRLGVDFGFRAENGLSQTARRPVKRAEETGGRDFKSKRNESIPNWKRLVPFKLQPVFEMIALARVMIVYK